MADSERQTFIDGLRAEVQQALRVGLQRTVHDPNLKDGPNHTADQIREMSRDMLVRNHGQS
jgi:hypothetical protein